MLSTEKFVEIAVDGLDLGGVARHVTSTRHSQ